MGQVLIRNLDEALLDDYRAAAKRAGRSLEAELRAALARARPSRGEDRRTLLSQVAGLIPTLPDGQTSTDAIRRDRDTNGGDWLGDDHDRLLRRG
jgi:plasmid stability protein